jgi:hypothetical protein
VELASPGYEVGGVHGTMGFVRKLFKVTLYDENTDFKTLISKIGHANKALF